jgi:TrmH family RNA methyltransferase
MIEIVFVEPQIAGNVGALCRVMKNFNFHDLVLVNPKCEYNDEEARKRAKHANDILADAKVINSLDDLKTDCLVGTTALIGTSFNVSRSPIFPRQFAEKAVKIKNKISLVFGRETEGLYNSEIEKCDFVITIPANRNYKTLNVSHSAAIILYELFMAKVNPRPIHESASENDKKQIIKLLKESMKSMDFLNDQKRQTQVKVWNRLISKSFITKREAFALMGFLKKLVK